MEVELIVFRAIRRMGQLFMEEFISMLLVGAIGGMLMLFIIPIPFVLGGYAAMADDLIERRNVGIIHWWRGARQMWRPAYVWGLVNLLAGVILWSALAFYGQVERMGALLQGLVLGVAYLWFTVQFYTLPLLRLNPHLGVVDLLRRAGLLALTAPLTTMLAMVFLLALAVPFLTTLPALLLLHPLFAILLATVMVRIRIGLPDTVSDELPEE